MAGPRKTPAGTRATGAAAASPREGGKRRSAEVFDTAVAIFHEQGYSETSVEDIANALGILKGSLYYYIKSKEDLLHTIVTEVQAEVLALLVEAVGRTDLTPLDRLAFYVRRQVEFNTQNVTKISVYYQDFERLSPDRLRETVKKRSTMTHMMIDLIKEAQEAGEIDASVDPALASHGVFATVNWLYRWYRPQGSVSATKLADFCVEYALHGLGGANPGAPTDVTAIVEHAEA